MAIDKNKPTRAASAFVTTGSARTWPGFAGAVRKPRSTARRPLEAMSAGEMDGFVAGLLVHPEIVPALEWLPHVWGLDTEFGNAEEVEAVAAVLIGPMVRDLNARKTFRGLSAAERVEWGVSPGPGATFPGEATCSCGSGRPYDRCCGAH